MGGTLRHVVVTVVGIALVATTLAHAPHALGNAKPAETWLPVACYEGYAFAERAPLARHDARACDNGDGTGRLEVYVHAALVDSVRFPLAVRIDADGGVDPGARAETWLVEGEERMRFVATHAPPRPATLWTPAAGGGHLGPWTFVALRHYA